VEGTRAGVDVDTETWDSGMRSGKDGIVIAGEVAARLDGPTDNGFSGTSGRTFIGEGGSTGVGMGSGSFSAPGKQHSSSSESSMTRCTQVVSTAGPGSSLFWDVVGNAMGSEQVDALRSGSVLEGGRVEK
jgi:hypothetical protein